MRPRVADDERTQALRRDGDALDPVRRLDALDERHLAQGPQKLGRLPGVEVLPTLRLGDIREKPDSPGGKRELGEPAVAE